MKMNLPALASSVALAALVNPSLKHIAVFPTLNIAT